MPPLTPSANQSHHRRWSGAKVSHTRCDQAGVRHVHVADGVGQCERLISSVDARPVATSIAPLRAFKVGPHSSGNPALRKPSIWRAAC